jgi:mRNA-degrading endonuclease toxin of MazEF toxin-antitoxin module
VVVSRQSLNRGKYVVIVPFTTTNLEVRRRQRSCVSFDEGDFGLTKDCVAQAEAIAQVRTVLLDANAGPLGYLDDDAMRDLVRAIGHVIESECERV